MGLSRSLTEQEIDALSYNRTTEIMKKFIARENPPGGLVVLQVVVVRLTAKRGAGTALSRFSTAGSWSVLLR